MHRVFAAYRHAIRTFLSALLVVGFGLAGIQAQDRPSANLVDDPYNMYFTPDGSAAIVVAEARKRQPGYG
jgi:hypothetical protein